MRMPFGKYGPKHFPPNGVDICYINSGYLKWVTNEESIFMDKRHEELVVAIEKELKWREDTDSHFYKDKVVSKEGR
jgi:hypothetical protein